MSEEDFEGWLLHPATKALKEYLRAQIELRKEQWASGAFTDQGQFATAIMNAKAIGNCEAYDEVMRLEYSQVVDSIGE